MLPFDRDIRDDLSPELDPVAAAFGVALPANRGDRLAQPIHPSELPLTSPFRGKPHSSANLGQDGVGRVLTTLGTVDPPYEVLDLHVDHLGSTRLMTDDLVTSTVRHDFFPFGEEMSPVLDLGSAKRFTGHERDRATGLDYMFARYYSADLGRFVGVDPVRGSQKRRRMPSLWNLYTYAGNNPVLFIDIDGRDFGVSEELRGSFKNAYMNSKTFRREFHKAKSDGKILKPTFKLSSAPPSADAGSVGNLNTLYTGTTKNHETGEVIEARLVKVGPIAIGAGGSDAAVGAVIGHELAELNGLANARGEPHTAKSAQTQAHETANGVEEDILDDYNDESDNVSEEEAQQALEGTEPATRKERKGYEKKWRDAGGK